MGGDTKRPDAYCAMSLVIFPFLRQHSPSPVLVAVPARVAPIASAILASLLKAPNDIAAIIMGVSSTSGFSA